MLATGVISSAATLAATSSFAPSYVAIVLAALGGIVGSFAAWRWKRGDFYKSVAEEKTAEASELRKERDELKQQRDLTPIVATLKQLVDEFRQQGEVIVQALDRHGEMTQDVFRKVGDMNGALRAHSTAMKALADRTVLDEAARALLAEAAKTKQPVEGGS